MILRVIRWQVAAPLGSQSVTPICVPPTRSHLLAHPHLLNWYIIHPPLLPSRPKFYIATNNNEEIGPKIKFGHNFWLEGPFDTRSTHLIWTVFCKIFSGTPHLTIFGSLKYVPKYAEYAKYAFLAHIWVRQIWSSGVSLKRSCKMLFRRIGLRSIGPSSQKLWPNQIFGRFPHCNYNVKLKMACTMSFMGL